MKKIKNYFDMVVIILCEAITPFVLRNLIKPFTLIDVVCKIYVIRIAIIILVLFLMKKMSIYKRNSYNTKDKFTSLFLVFFIAYILIEAILMIVSLRMVHEKINYTYEIFLSIVQLLEAGFVEESVYRGILFQTLYQNMECKNKRTKAIIISSTLFAIRHYQDLFEGNESFKEYLIKVIARSIPSIGFTLIYLYRNIWSAIIIHALYDYGILLENLLFGTNYGPSNLPLYKEKLIVTAIFACGIITALVLDKRRYGEGNQVSNSFLTVN